MGRCLQSLDIASALCIEMFRMKRPNNRNGRHHVRFRISHTPIDTVVDMLREDNNGKNVVLHRTHLRNISDQDFIILEKSIRSWVHFTTGRNAFYRFDKNIDSINDFFNRSHSMIIYKRSLSCR